MEIVLATHGFDRPGGSETYLLTVAEQLQRLGHQVSLFVHETGLISQFAAGRGNRVVADEAELPASCDVLLAQDGVVACELADRYPATPLVFRCASDLHDLQLPPNVPGLCAAVVVLSERVAHRVRALAVGPELVRLRQPIDTERFMVSGPCARAPRRALLLGNHLRGPRRDLLVGTLEAAGVECVGVGRAAPQVHVEHAIWDADMVVAKGRAALEGMACGRPVYVYDQFGADGWVTPERYPALEADNFAGLAFEECFDRPRIERDLAAYDPHMGTVNRDLVTRHHGARRHAQELSQLFARLAPRPRALDHLRELARLVRWQWQTEQRALGFAYDNDVLRTRIEQLERDRDELIARLEELRSAATEAPDRSSTGGARR